MFNSKPGEMAVPRLVFASRRSRQILEPMFAGAALLFAFSSWPFFWSDAFRAHSRIATAGAAMMICVAFGLLRTRIRANAYVVMFAMYLVLLFFATVLSEHTAISAKAMTRLLLYVLMLGLVVALSSISPDLLARIANAMIFLFLVLAVPSLVLFALVFFRIDLPYLLINLGGRGDLYRLYPLGIMADYTIRDFLGAFDIARVNGFSEEPGVLGTYVVFLLILNHYVGSGRKKTVASWLLHALGLVSFSIFYFASALVFLGARWTRQMLTRGRRVAAVIAALVIAVAAAVVLGSGLGRIDFDFPHVIASSALSETRVYLNINTRYEYDVRLRDYLASASFERVLIGHGPGGNSLDDAAQFASWISELYDSGAMSVLVVVWFFVYVAVRASYRYGRFSPQRLLILLPAFLSYYQRPEMLSPMLIVFWVVIMRLKPGVVYRRVGA